MIKIGKNEYEILDLIKKRNYPIRFLFFNLACFIFALNYNAFFAPKKIVTGGMSGMAIITKEVFGLPIQYFLYTSMAVLLIIALIFLGKEKFINTLLGSLAYNLMITLTAPIVDKLNLHIDSFFILIIISSILNGVANGIIYRSGFNTGGADVISSVLSKYSKIPIGKCNQIVNTIIIGLGTLVFGLTNTIYAIIILTISSKLIDVVMLGINDSKMCYIKSPETKKIKETLLSTYKIGITEVNNRGGIFQKKYPILIAIIPFDLYPTIKEGILKIDDKAFIVCHDCYAVSGGYKKHILPF